MKPDDQGKAILTHAEARGVILAHEDVNRRALQEIHAMLPELIHGELLQPEGAQKIQTIVRRTFNEGLPELG